MAGNRIKGITIEFGGDTTKLTNALKQVDSSLKNTQTQLKDVNKLLKLDPKNVELLKQKQELLNKAVQDTKQRADQLKEALKQMESAGITDANREQYQALQRELVETEVKLKDLTKQAQEANPALQVIGQTAGEVADKTKRLSQVAGGLLVSFVALGAKSASSADDLATLARNTGLSVEELQKFQYASDFVDVSMESMTGSITKLTRNMSSGAEVFDKLGVSIRDDLTGEMRDATDVWYDSLQALSQVENETERDALSMELFGKSAMEMSGIVDDGGEALKALGEEAEETGLILSEDAVNSAVEFNDAVDKMKNTATQAFFKAGATLATTLTPALEKVVDVVVKALEWFGNLDGETQKLILTILAVVASISPIAKIISGITTVTSTLSSVLGFLTSPLGLVVVAIGAVVAIAMQMGVTWEDVMAIVQQFGQTFMDVWNNIVAFFEPIITQLSEVFTSCFQSMWDLIQTVVGAISTFISEHWNEIQATTTMVFNVVSSTIGTAFQQISNVVSTVIGVISGIIKTFTSLLRGDFSGAFSAIKSTVDTVLGGIKRVFETTFNGIKSFLSPIIDWFKNIFDFKWELPKIKLPHFSLVGEFSLVPPSVPHLDVEWYKKAYTNPILFNSPTILPTVNGFKGFGDGAGSELVIGTNKLMQMMSGVAGNDIDINIYAQQGMSPNQIADAVAIKLDRWLGARV